MARARLYHNADCSKCRGALELLIQRGVDVEIVNYLDHPPSADALRDLVRMLGLPASALLRTPIDDAQDDEAVIAALVADPASMQRPIFVRDGRAVIARPAERVLELL